MSAALAGWVLTDSQGVVGVDEAELLSSAHHQSTSGKLKQIDRLVKRFNNHFHLSVFIDTV